MLTQQDLDAIQAMIGPRFDGIETRFDTLETRFDTLETRFDTLETRFDTLQEDLRMRTIQNDGEHHFLRMKF